MGCSSSQPSFDEEPPTSSSTPSRRSTVLPAPSHAPPSSKALRLHTVRGFAPVTSPDYDHLFRIMILGDSGVGKSSVAVTFSSGHASTGLPATVGVDILMKNATINGLRIRLQLFDPAGHERNWMRMSNFGLWKSANAVIVMYDLTQRLSFDNCQNWVESAEMTMPKQVPMILVGNKTDRAAERCVESWEGEELAKQRNIPYFETSAATASGVEELFLALGRMMLVSSAPHSIAVPQERIEPQS